jgi:hypothetical protein
VRLCFEEEPAQKDISQRPRREGRGVGEFKKKWDEAAKTLEVREILLVALG